jgi:hypothetical protein
MFGLKKKKEKRQEDGEVIRVARVRWVRNEACK